ncbi:LOW QUALITY PROTEIN: uncharacterized protein [Typha latifolia]|uniref:LOW QUALITY PROTEIN: uncharacterized protein n=1 Tax=Typha latifolia TaxID=4733 RepID=UPI003C2F1AF8
MVGAGKRRPPKPSSFPPPHWNEKPKPSSSSSSASLFTISDLNPLLSLLASSISLSLRFLSSHDLLLLPSQTLALDSFILSSSLSLSRLLSLLPLPLQTLTLTTISLEPPFPSPSLPSSWFLRFLSSPSHSSSSSLWLDSFRMSRSSFYHLLQALSPSLSASTSLALPPDHKLGAALFRLAHAAPFRAVARRFGLPLPAVACRAFYEVVKAIADCLGELLELSSARVLDRFNSLHLFNCCGVIGFASFPVKEGSVIAQGLVDAEGRFLDVSAGWHGEMTPAEILSKSKLSNAHLVLGNGRYVLGGSCCPLLPWLLTPFKKEEASEDCSKNSIFNDAHARLMEVSENAFARVRARWRLLGTRWNGECDEALPYVIVASCLLHNYLLERGEPMPEEGDGNVKEQEFLDFEGDGDEEGKMIREVIASHLRMVSQR